MITYKCAICQKMITSEIITKMRKFCPECAKHRQQQRFKDWYEKNKENHLAYCKEYQQKKKGNIPPPPPTPLTEEEKKKEKGE